MMTYSVGIRAYLACALQLLAAQICNLLYRRFATGRRPHRRRRNEFTDTPQNAILRYSRLQICAAPAGR
jgi:hypothetical protein